MARKRVRLFDYLLIKTNLGAPSKINDFENCSILPIHLRKSQSVSLARAVSKSGERGSVKPSSLTRFFDLIFWDIFYKNSFLSNSIWLQSRSLDDQTLLYQLYHQMCWLSLLEKKTFSVFSFLITLSILKGTYSFEHWKVLITCYSLTRVTDKNEAKYFVNEDMALKRG